MGGLSDHLPIYMEMECGRARSKRPFKFSSTWLKEASYISMVTDFWKTNSPRVRGVEITGFICNLAELKKMSKIWAHQKRIQDDQDLRQIEIELEVFENALGGLYILEEHKNKITSLYSTHGEILKEREDKWRLRSRAIWIQEGDANTKFYQKFANGRKAINTI